MTDQRSDRAARPPVLSAAGYLLMKGGLLIGRAFDEALGSCDLTARQFLLISIVAESKGESQLEVSRLLHLDPTIVVALIDELEGRGLMTRRRHPGDRRRSVLELTAAGAKLQRKASSLTARAEAAFLADLTPAERDVFHDALARVVLPKLDQL